MDVVHTPGKDYVVADMLSWSPALHFTHAAARPTNCISAAYRPGLPGGRGHGPFAQKGPYSNILGREKLGAVRGREGAVKRSKMLKMGSRKLLYVS